MRSQPTSDRGMAGRVERDAASIHTEGKEDQSGGVGAPIMLSDLSPARQALVRLAQRVNYGRIEHLVVRGGDPVLGPELVVVTDIKLDGDGAWRPEVGLNDFNLPKELCALMSELDQIQNGEIESIQVLAGLPRRITVRSTVEDAPR